MKSNSTPTIVLAILLTIWAHVAVGWVENFTEFLECLEEEIEEYRGNIFEFTETDNVIEKLNNTPTAFKRDCVANYNARCTRDRSRRSLISATLSRLTVQRVILKRFKMYGRCMDDVKRVMLWIIHTVDPIGFLVHLNGENAYSPGYVSEHVIEFYRRMPLPPPSEHEVVEPGSTSSGNAALETGSTSAGSSELETEPTSSGTNTKLECSICLTDLKPEAPDKWDAPKCSHAFHHGCIQKWIDACGTERPATCPCCRAVIQD